jgi:threonine/homoserine/homoserine lactone efflux protein
MAVDLVLLWMGAGLIRRVPTGADPSGAVMTALNPYRLFWWLTVEAGFIARARAYPAGWIITGMIALHLACDFAWGTFLSWAAWWGGGGFSEAGCESALAGFGLYFFWEGVWKL